ncbi:hypothetical protein GCM10007854_14350 [Algimonas porphyrae]|uniref:Uncharacterized protein n=1 Tax=Algimonas porphyrae TaxID=1128113 RepID=A0ABQ5V1F9_9PROT|nr:hypothetical protein GCM10007854_14350 [Algimonas porphyrae]
MRGALVACPRPEALTPSGDAKGLAGDIAFGSGFLKSRSQGLPLCPVEQRGIALIAAGRHPSAVDARPVPSAISN